MVVLTAEQVRNWDEFTIQTVPIASIDLMERAAQACVDWMANRQLVSEKTFYVFCGKGNNGGDGLAIARLLQQYNCLVEVFILEFGQPGSPDFQQNLNRLHSLPIRLHYIQETSELPHIPADVIVIDALFGTGLNRATTRHAADLISHINAAPNGVISIDLPSGLFADGSSTAHPVIEAAITLSFQCYKLALLMAENARYTGLIDILDIGLHSDYLSQIDPAFELVDASVTRSLITPRPSSSHKGKFGHALLLAGSTGKMGAAVLAATACLRTGAGLLSVLVPARENSIIQTGLPEAMSLPYETEDQPETFITDLNVYKTIGIGPGLGTEAVALNWLKYLLLRFQKPIVIDADALNLLARHTELWETVPAFSIITPHPKEFDRLAGKHLNDFDRLNSARNFAIQHQVIVVLKGHRTCIAMPGGRAWFNTSGNASMAKGGSGDVLTGMLTGLIARGYAPEQAALLGVFLHGCTGELASQQLGMESVLASDLINAIGPAFQQLISNQQV